MPKQLWTLSTAVAIFPGFPPRLFADGVLGELVVGVCDCTIQDGLRPVSRESEDPVLPRRELPSETAAHLFASRCQCQRHKNWASNLGWWGSAALL